MITAENLTQLQVVSLLQELIRIDADNFTTDQRHLYRACGVAMGGFDTTDVLEAKQTIAVYLNAGVTDDEIRAWWETGARGGGADVHDMLAALGECFMSEPSATKIRASRSKIAAAIAASRWTAG